MNKFITPPRRVQKQKAYMCWQTLGCCFCISRYNCFCIHCYYVALACFIDLYNVVIACFIDTSPRYVLTACYNCFCCKCLFILFIGIHIFVICLPYLVCYLHLYFVISVFSVSILAQAICFSSAVLEQALSMWSWVSPLWAHHLAWRTRCQNRVSDPHDKYNLPMFVGLAMLALSTWN